MLAVIAAPRELEREIAYRRDILSGDLGRTVRPSFDPELSPPPLGTELLTVDEADHLKTNGLEQLRDYFDRNDLGLILIGVPGLERRLARYPKLDSRVRFAHPYRPLDSQGIPQALTQY